MTVFASGALRFAVPALTVLLAAGCATTGQGASVSRGSSAPTASLRGAPAATTRPAAPAAQTWVMPDLRGTDLQTAQDAIQSLTRDSVYFTRSHDLSGRGRHQILDRDWQVCTQNVPPGATFTEDSEIDFGVVRVEVEACP